MYTSALSLRHSHAAMSIYTCVCVAPPKHLLDVLVVFPNVSELNGSNCYSDQVIFVGRDPDKNVSTVLHLLLSQC